jgi:hypothetical protein
VYPSIVETWSIGSSMYGSPNFFKSTLQHVLRTVFFFKVLLKSIESDIELLWQQGFQFMCLVFNSFRASFANASLVNVEETKRLFISSRLVLTNCFDEWRAIFCSVDITCVNETFVKTCWKETVLLVAVV